MCCCLAGTSHSVTGSCLAFFMRRSRAGGAEPQWERWLLQPQEGTPAWLLLLHFFFFFSSFLNPTLFCKSVCGLPSPTHPPPSFSSSLPIPVFCLHIFFIAISSLNLFFKFSLLFIITFFFKFFSLCVLPSSFFYLPSYITTWLCCQNPKTNLLWFTVLKSPFSSVSASMHQTEKETCLRQEHQSVCVCVCVI